MIFLLLMKKYLQKENPLSEPVIAKCKSFRSNSGIATASMRTMVIVTVDKDEIALLKRSRNISTRKKEKNKIGTKVFP